jgi:hypothetical protein
VTHGTTSFLRRLRGSPLRCCTPQYSTWDDPVSTPPTSYVSLSSLFPSLWRCDPLSCATLRLAADLLIGALFAGSWPRPNTRTVTSPRKQCPSSAGQ